MANDGRKYPNESKRTKEVAMRVQKLLNEDIMQRQNKTGKATILKAARVLLHSHNNEYLTKLIEQLQKLMKERE